MSNAVLCLLLLLVLSLLLGHILKQKESRWLQVSGVATILGALFGLILTLVGEQTTFKPITALNAEFLFLFLLPPIIFESGYNMDKVNFT